MPTLFWPSWLQSDQVELKYLYAHLDTRAAPPLQSDQVELKYQSSRMRRYAAIKLQSDQVELKYKKLREQYKLLTRFNRTRWN